MKIQEKNTENTGFQNNNKENEDETFDNKLEYTRYLAEVKSPIKNNIKADYTLAYINEKEKEAATEMLHNASYGNRLITYLKEKSTQWKYNHENQTWIQTTLNQTQKNTLDKLQKEQFEMYMTRIHMIMILNRNTKENPLVQTMARIAGAITDKENEEQTPTTTTEENDTDLTKKIKNITKRK